jgi:hypothetical protein
MDRARRIQTTPLKGAQKNEESLAGGRLDGSGGRTQRL